MTTVKYQEKHVTVNGVPLRYLDWGTAGKPPLVCLHGHAGNAHIWDEFAEAMSSRYHVFAIDQRGHGESQWAETGYARDRFVEDLAAFVDAVNLSSFVLVGLSMGGWNSMLYTRDHPDRVERIILVDISPELSSEFLAAWEDRPPTLMDFPSLDAAVGWMRQQSPWVDVARLRKDAEDKMRKREDGTWTWKADPALFNAPSPDMTDPGHIQRYWDSIAAITCPILEVRGMESDFVSDDVLHRMERVVKQFSWADVPGAGHVVTVDRPQEFIEATRSFLGVPA